jgi:hypothetical protein
MLLSCQQEEIYSVIPAITYKGFVKHKSIFARDSALKLTLTYTDGDGDLGLTQDDTLPPFDKSSFYYYNMYVYYYEYIDGQFQQVTLNDFSTDTIRFKYRFPNLTPTTDNKAIRGEIEYTITDLFPRKSNTIKFRIYIYDRKLQKSNEIESAIITYNP